MRGGGSPAKRENEGVVISGLMLAYFGPSRIANVDDMRYYVATKTT